MATTALERQPTRRLRNLSPYLNWNSPLDTFFRNDFLDIWDDDTAVTVPSINITEEEDNYIVSMAVPGLKKENFDINLEGNLLTISAETETNGREGRGNSRKEYNYSSFTRTVTLPNYAEEKDITAKYSDGILRLTILKNPESEKSRRQRIKVQ